MSVLVVVLLVVIFNLSSSMGAPLPLGKYGPVIGVVTQPNEYGWPGTRPYIAASYVKYVESAGARVVPIFFDGTDDYLEAMFEQINGVLFPGGGQDLDGSQLLHTANFFVKKSLMAAANGDYFPVAGHCQGFEVMLMAITSLELEKCMVNEEKYRAENVSLPLHSINPHSRWFANASADVLTTLTSTACTINNHMWATPVKLWNSLPGLEQYRVVSTTMSPAGYEFISNYEHTQAPIFAMQFHAEKPQFEWPNENIDHSRASIRAMQFFSNFLVDEASKSAHVFKNASQLDNALIYNWNPVYSIQWSSFDQIYYF